MQLDRFTQKAQETILAAQATAERLRVAAGSSGKSPVELGQYELVLAGDATVADEVASMNVVAKLEGSDPKLKSEAVVIGSHPTCDLVLSGLKPRHAVIGRDVQGRTVLKALAGRCYVDGSPVVSQVVDEDSDIRLGEHRLTLGQVAAANPV